MLGCICGFSIETILLVFTILIGFIADRFICWCNICNGAIKNVERKKYNRFLRT